MKAVFKKYEFCSWVNRPVYSGVPFFKYKWSPNVSQLFFGLIHRHTFNTRAQICFLGSFSNTPIQSFFLKVKYLG
jgi:hypothetical protein